MINKLTLLNSKSASARCDWVVRYTPTLTLTPWVVREKDMRHSDPSHWLVPLTLTLTPTPNPYP